MRKITLFNALTLPLAVGLLLAACGDAQAGAGGERASAGEVRSSGDAVPASADTVAPAEVRLGYSIGESEAPVAVVEFSDFGCPYCARFARSTLPVLKQEYIDTGRMRWRYIPVVFGFAGGELMGAAAECAADQGGGEAFWAAHDVLYRHQTALRGEDARPRLLDRLVEAGLDRDALDRCIDSPEIRERLIANTQLAQEWYVRGTPTFLVNGVPMSGAMPVDFFRKVLATVEDPSGL
ncbi:MAG: thioredoxin domain-containing protein [Gemmatimonadota bacterium]